MQRLGWILQAGFYIIAGINHFRDPEFYLPLIPPAFPYPEAINIGSGIIEVILGALLLFGNTRKYGAWGIIIILLSFIPSHVYFIMEGSCVGKLCVPAWIGWARLLIIHPLLLLWAWKYTKKFWQLGEQNTSVFDYKD